MNNKRIAYIAVAAVIGVIALLAAINEITARNIEDQLMIEKIERACSAFAHRCDGGDILREYGDEARNCIKYIDHDFGRGACMMGKDIEW